MAVCQNGIHPHGLSSLNRKFSNGHSSIVYLCKHRQPKRIIRRNRRIASNRIPSYTKMGMDRDYGTIVDHHIGSSATSFDIGI